MSHRVVDNQDRGIDNEARVISNEARAVRNNAKATDNEARRSRDCDTDVAIGGAGGTGGSFR